MARLPEVGPAASVAVGRAFLAAGAVDRGAVSPRAGLAAAIPVAGMLALGTVVGQPVGAVTMAVGAMLVGVAWRAGGGPVSPPLGTMASAATALALATLAGTATGRWPWLHLAVLVVVCLVAGSFVALGRRGVVVGTQSVIAFIVFGRFPESLPSAAGLAGLVLAGGAAQTAFAWLVAAPPAWRQQRAAVADAYRALASLADSLDRPSVPMAVALDAAEARLTAPGLLADRARMELLGLVHEGRRIRLELVVLRAAIEPMRRAADKLDRDLDPVLRQVSTVLRWIAAIVSGESDAHGALNTAADELDQSILGVTADSRVDARLAALAGQVLGSARMTTAASRRVGRWRAIRPSRGSRLPFADLPDDIRRIRAAASLQSAAGRHALRLALVVAGTELLTQRVALPRGYWAVVAAATVLRPDFSATFTRGAERVLGTCFGVVIATLIAVAVDPRGWGIVVVVGLLAFGTYAVFPASFAAGTALLTAVIVFLLHTVAPDSSTIALDRGIDTVIGGAIGLAAYALWPTWSGTSTGRLLAEVVDAQKRYLGGVFRGLIAGEPPDDAELRPLARRARMNYSEAEAAVTLTYDEPLRGTDPQRAAGALAELRRLVYGVHALRLEAGTLADRQPLPALVPLADGLAESLDLIASDLRDDSRAGQLPALRSLYRGAVSYLPPETTAAVRIGLDELVDATDTLAVSLGLRLP